jgi:hypothetical protein
MYFAGSQLAVFQGANERPYLNHTGRESNAEKRPTGSGPKGCDENGPATALLVGHVPPHFHATLETKSTYQEYRKWSGMLRSPRLVDGPF